MMLNTKRLTVMDCEQYVQLRVEGFTHQTREFRFSPQDERGLKKDDIINRIKHEFIIGVFDQAELIAIGGVTPYSGSKLNHRALLWGMYVKPDYRGLGLSNKIVESLLSESKERAIEQVLLTVVSENKTAINLYEKWGFTPYAIDRLAVKVGENDYLDEMLMVKSLI